MIPNARHHVNCRPLPILRPRIRPNAHLYFDHSTTPCDTGMSPPKRQDVRIKSHHATARRPCKMRRQMQPGFLEKRESTLPQNREQYFCKHPVHLLVSRKEGNAAAVEAASRSLQSQSCD